MDEELKRPERPCGLLKAGNNCRGRNIENCRTCGWDPEEERRRKALPLKRGADGRYHKDISQSEIGDQPGGD